MKPFNVYRVKYENQSYGDAWYLIAARSTKQALSIANKEKKPSPLDCVTGYWFVEWKLSDVEYSGTSARVLSFFAYFE